MLENKTTWLLQLHFSGYPGTIENKLCQFVFGRSGEHTTDWEQKKAFEQSFPDEANWFESYLRMHIHEEYGTVVSQLDGDSLYIEFSEKPTSSILEFIERMVLEFLQGRAEKLFQLVVHKKETRVTVLPGLRKQFEDYYYMGNEDGQDRPPKT